MSLRQHVKSVVEQGLLVSGWPRFSRWRRGGDILILAYHNIVPTGGKTVGDRSLHLPQQAFATQLDLLRATHDIISLEEALTRGARSMTRASAVITFDDAYTGSVTAGISELSTRRLPATIFVPPAFLNGGIFWWDVLTPTDSDALPPEFRERVLSRLAGKGAMILSESQLNLPPEIPAHARGATEDELQRASGVPGITIASHTWSHPNLAALNEDELQDELRRPLVWLGERFATMVPYISYPYGLSSPLVERVAAQAGYKAALRVEGGWLPKEPKNLFTLPRLNVPSGISAAGFQLRCAGILS